MKHILVVCGAGASSTFLAHRMRKAVAAQNLRFTVSATSQSLAPGLLAQTDLLLVGPHLAADFERLRVAAESAGTLSSLLTETAFAVQGGQDAVDLAVALFDSAAISSPQPHRPEIESHS